MQDQKKGDAKSELFDLEADPGEKTDLAAEKPEVAGALAGKLRQWQESVLKSLVGEDYTR